MQALCEALRAWRPRPWCQGVDIMDDGSISLTLGYVSQTGWALPEVRVIISSLEGAWGI